MPFGALLHAAGELEQPPHVAIAIGAAWKAVRAIRLANLGHAVRLCWFDGKKVGGNLVSNPTVDVI